MEKARIVLIHFHCVLHAQKQKVGGGGVQIALKCTHNIWNDPCPFIRSISIRPLQSFQSMAPTAHHCTSTVRQQPSTGTPSDVGCIK